jgi:hypothetical protein
MKSNYFPLYLFVILMAASCNKTTIDPTKETVAITAVLSKKNGIEVILSKALDPIKEYLVKDIPNTFLIKDANVALYEDGNLVETLSYENDKYVSKNANWKATEGKKYKIVAKIIDYGTTESEDVIFPKEAFIQSISHTTYTYDSPNYNPSNASAVKIVSEIKSNGVQKEYYKTSYKGFSKKGDLVSNPYPVSTEENKELNEKIANDCGAKGGLFTNDCLLDNKFYDYILFYGYVTTSMKEVQLEKIEVSFDTVSESLHKYVTNYYNRDQVDTRFEDIPASYTNIKNGIGIFYAVNEGEKVFVVKP